MREDRKEDKEGRDKGKRAEVFSREGRERGERGEGREEGVPLS